MPTAAEMEAAAPPWWLLALEGRAVFEWGAWWLSKPWFQHAPRGNAHPVLVLPGLIAGDPSTWPLRRFLGELGYHARPWEEGINRGPQPGLQERLLRRIEALADEHGEQVSLVGWSLGGLMARALAWHRPELVRTVITLGSPLSALPGQTNAARVFRLASGLDPEDPDLRRLLGGDPQVPLTSILSRTDGVVHWRASLAPQGERCESIEVPASHLGLGVNPLALYAIADRLAQDPALWQPFEHSGWRRLVFRNPQLERLFGG
ncbi:alpha/beta fold hydrolase [Pseudomarimonas salicorniae]|uniref:GPI inositol-deacylase n=1 Tax=Pseudomarimonas salicorniae TaxID=2933270 RepID=A0ABT0GME7_9GAMM|nr:alpha/beta hydrolase [Lysobacter sp. CAU 1642]MCK7595394.1 GPI inositol-deacylase [Lysobacter sp. CAU 1642]